MESAQSVRRNWLRLPTPKLRFNPTAYAKLRFLRDYGRTEVGGFAVTATHDPLYVTDFRLVRQVCSPISVRFEDAAVADFFDAMVDDGCVPENFARVWLHTHPGDDPTPSRLDETTFARCFGDSDWTVMAILAQSGASYVRLRFNIGPGGSIEIPAEVCYERPFAASDFAGWEREYSEHVREEPSLPARRSLDLAAEPDRCVLDDVTNLFDLYYWEEAACPTQSSDTHAKPTSSRTKPSSS